MAQQPINLYGDRHIPTTGRHGSNITEQRVDELDKACLDFVKAVVKREQSCQAIDIGGGSGAQSKRMAELGASVVFIDLTDQKHSIDEFNKKLGRTAIQFIQSDARNNKQWPTSIHCVYSQRMLGCIPYDHALQLLSLLKSQSSTKAYFFLSTGGLDSEYGTEYPDRNKPVNKRFASFSVDMADKHGIYSPECLYREKELCQLVEEAGLIIDRSWTSAFGNPKVIGLNE